MKNFDMQLRAAAPIVLRVALALVFFWFGTQQLTNPGQWVRFLPGFLGGLPIALTTIVALNGWFEIVAGLALLFGLYTRLVALLLSLHLLGITVTLGLNAIGIRDFGLTFAAFTVALQGAGSCSLDNWFAKSQNSSLQNSSPL